MSFTILPASPIDGDAVLPIAAAKAHLKVLDDGEDDLIGALRDAAIDWLEGYCAIALTSRAFTVRGDRFRRHIDLPVAPVTAVAAIDYLDPAGATVPLAAEAYRLVGNRIVLAAGCAWPVTFAGDGAVTVTFTAGFADAAAQAPALVAAVKLLLGNLFRFREAAVTGQVISEIPFGVEQLCRNYRMPRL